jgi:tetratricopeptide (TPR) repeat protein
MNLADCYRLLGLRTGASFEEIKASYRRLARQYHPDVNPQNQQAAKEKFIQLTEAYKYLISVVQPPEGTTTASASSFSKPPRPAATPTPSPTAQPPQVKVTRKQQPRVEVDRNLSEVDRQLKQSSYEQLQQLLKSQRFPRAIALVEGLAQRLPNDQEVRQWQAITYQRFGHHLANTKEVEKARVYLKKALRTDPHNKALWYEVERDFRRIEEIL